MSGEEKHRFWQGVHGSCSKLHDDGRIRRVSTKVNPTTGAEVYVYAVEEIQRQPQVKVTKSWKDKCLALQAEMKEKDEQIEFLIMRNDKLREELEKLKGQKEAA